MHRLRLLYALWFVLSTDLTSKAQSIANLGFSPRLKAIVSFCGATAWLPALCGLQSDRLLSSDNNSAPGIGLLRVRLDRKLFSKAKSEFVPDDSLTGSAPSSAPARPSPIP